MEITDINFKSFLATYDLILTFLFIKFHWFISHRKRVLTQHQTKASVRIKTLIHQHALKVKFFFRPN